MGTQTTIYEDHHWKIDVWCNPNPTSLIVTPKTGYNVGDDEEVTLEVTPHELGELTEFMQKAGVQSDG